MSIENERKITILHNSIGSNKQIVVKNGWVVIIDCSSLLLGSNNIVVFLTIQYYFLSLRHE